jgi:transposase-like protein
MTLEQSQATESQVRYSPEEAHEILRLAAEMQESALSVEQLRRIAQEAGIADEYLGRAIQHYEQRRCKGSARGCTRPHASVGSNERSGRW